MSKGPTYGANIPTEPVKVGGMLQAVPGECELRYARDEGFERLVAAYEVISVRWMLYEWACEMHCQLFRDADITRSDVWMLTDIDGGVLGRGDTPTEAIADARNKFDGVHESEASNDN